MTVVNREAVLFALENAQDGDDLLEIIDGFISESEEA